MAPSSHPQRRCHPPPALALIPLAPQSQWERAPCQESCPAHGLLGTRSRVSAGYMCVAVLGERAVERPGPGSILLPPLGADTLTDPVTDPGPNPSSDTAIWRRIFQSSYIREQYVLTHCSASPEPGPGSTGSSESPRSQGPGSPEGSAPLDPPSQQGCRSLPLSREPPGSRSCPLPPPPLAPVKVRFSLHHSEPSEMTPGGMQR